MNYTYQYSKNISDCAIHTAHIKLSILNASFSEAIFETETLPCSIFILIFFWPYFSGNHNVETSTLTPCAVFPFSNHYILYNAVVLDISLQLAQATYTIHCRKGYP